MATKVMNQDTNPAPLDDDLHHERAPSLLREEEPRFARMLGFFGMLCVFVAAIGLVMQAFERASRVGPGLSTFFAIIGFAALLFHASREREPQIRRGYGLFGVGLLLLAAALSAIPVRSGAAGLMFLNYGMPLLFVALFFLMAFAHNETDEGWRERITWLVGGAGATLALIGFVGGSFSQDFLLPFGVVAALLGLGYLWAFIGLHGSASDTGYRAGVLIGLLGGLMTLIALGRAFLPGLLYSMGALTARPTSYLVPSGLLLISLGLLYFFLAAGICSDNRLVVMTRRELAAFFYSPIAYIVLFALSSVAWLQYYLFLNLVLEMSQPGMGGSPLVEPVIRYYIINWFPVMCVIFGVPALTMRLLSEERRAGTLEVLLTAPVDELSVVLSKFLAVLIFYLLTWLPWGLFLVALRIQGGEPFDYRPALSFFFALAGTGAGFLAMGIFFSSLTRNQIAAFILTVAAMMGLTALLWLQDRLPPGSPGAAAMEYVSYISFWLQAIEGTLSPRSLMIHISTAIFWLFLTIKVLEARRWS